MSRHDLGPFRVAALGVEARPDGTRVARAAVWSGLGLYHEASPALVWTLDGAPLGEGFDVEVPVGGALGLAATSPDGLTREATVTVADPPPAPTLSRAAVRLSNDDLSLDARAAAEERAVERGCEADEAARLRLSLEGDASGYVARWMSADGLGTLLELDALSADILAFELVFDDGVVAEATPSVAGIYPQLALILDGAGSDRWLWADAAIGEDRPMLRAGGRLLPLEEDLDVSALSATGYVALTLEQGDDRLGLRFTDPVAVEPIDGGPDLSAADALDCALPDQPFDLAWVAEGRCPRPDVLGARVLLEVW